MPSFSFHVYISYPTLIPDALRHRLLFFFNAYNIRGSQFVQSSKSYRDHVFFWSARTDAFTVISQDSFSSLPLFRSSDAAKCGILICELLPGKICLKCWHNILLSKSVSSRRNEKTMNTMNACHSFYVFCGAHS